MGQQSKRNKRAAVGGLAISATLLASACAPIPRNHGYVPPDDELREVQVGRDTRETVSEKIGSPLNFGMERDESWLYISSRRVTFGMREPQTLSREIVAISFADSGQVQNIERFDLSDGRIVTLSSRVTDPTVSDLGLIRQIFGGLGTPTADQFLEPN